MKQNESNTFRKYLTPKWGLLLLILIYFSLQIPFIKADPDIQISWSRGANTDEGLPTLRKFETSSIMEN